MELWKNDSRPFVLGTMYWVNPNSGCPATHPNHQIDPVCSVRYSSAYYNWGCGKPYSRLQDSLNYSRAEIERDFARIVENNLTMIRVFAWWERLEQRKGTFEFQQHDLVYEAAEKRGIGIMESLGLYPPFWLKRELASVGIEDRTRYYCLDRPEVAEPMARYIEAVVTRYRGASALRMWNVWNEPTQPACHCPHTRKKFLAWLRARYPTTESLRHAWLSESGVFEGLCPEDRELLDETWLDDAFRFGSRGRITPLEYDWHRFTMHNLNDNLRWLVDEVKRHDQEHETHANFNCPITNGTENGIDHAVAAGVPDSFSLSVHPSHAFGNATAPEEYPVTHSFISEKLSAWGRAADADAWIGELQAGTTFFHENRYTPTADDIRHSLWQAFARGVRGALFWEWQSWRSSMMEVGEFSLRSSADGGPTERSEAASQVGRILAEHKELFGDVRPRKPEIAVLLSSDAAIFKALQHEAKPYIRELVAEHHYAVYGCYRALHRFNLAVDFVGVEQVEQMGQIQAGALDGYRVLYLPHVEIMREETARGIAEFVKRGGRVWADGRCAFLDEHVFLRQTNPGHGLDAVFGCREADFVAAREEPSLARAEAAPVRGHRFAQYLEPSTGRVTGWFPNDRPGIVTNRYGEGTAELVGTCLTLGLRERPDDATMDYLASVAFAAGVAPDLELEPRVGFETRLLTGASHDVIVATNHTGTPAGLEIITPTPYVEVVCPMDVEERRAGDNAPDESRARRRDDPTADGRKRTTLADGRITRVFDTFETAVICCTKPQGVPQT